MQTKIHYTQEDLQSAIRALDLSKVDRSAVLPWIIFTRTIRVPPVQDRITRRSNYSVFFEIYKWNSWTKYTPSLVNQTVFREHACASERGRGRENAYFPFPSPFRSRMRVRTHT